MIWPEFPTDPKAHRGARVLRESVKSRSLRISPWLVGGAADLAPSTKTRLTFEGAGDFFRRELRRA